MSDSSLLSYQYIYIHTSILHLTAARPFMAKNAAAYAGSFVTSFLNGPNQLPFRLYFGESDTQTSTGKEPRPTAVTRGLSPSLCIFFTRPDLSCSVPGIRNILCRSIVTPLSTFTVTLLSKDSIFSLIFKKNLVKASLESLDKVNSTNLLATLPLHPGSESRGSLSML